MSEKFVHIGLSKSASRTLQHHIFPKISEICSRKKKLIYYQKDKKLKNYYNNYFNSLIFSKKFKKINHKNDVIISSDRLWTFRGDPFYLEEYAKKNLNFFGKNTNIIIVIRSPREFLTSSYLQNCIYDNNYIEPDIFFLKKKFYSEKSSLPKFSIDDFSYKKIINVYRSLFKTVSVIKFETLKNKDLNFFSKIFKNLKFKDIKFLSEMLRDKNYSFSMSYATIKKIKNSKILKLFDLNETKLNDLIYLNDFISQNDNLFSNLRSRKIILEKKIKNLNEKLILEKYQKIQNSKKLFNFLDKSTDKSKKFMLDFKKVPQIKINNLINEYNSIPKFKIYKKK